MKLPLRLLLLLATILACATISVVAGQEAHAGMGFERPWAFERESGFGPDFNAPGRGGGGAGYAKEVLDGGTGQALAGHGELRFGAGEFVVPEGTSISFYSGRGLGIPDEMGQLIEAGDYAKIMANPEFRVLTEGAVTHLPGSTVPNWTLKAPSNLRIYRNSTTVEDATSLSDLLQPGMGPIDWAACLKNRR
jgi:hypothetical protein